MSLPNSRTIPDFVKAQSEQGLRREILKAQAKYGVHFQIISINYVNKSWVAWFQRPLLMNDPFLRGE